MKCARGFRRSFPPSSCSSSEHGLVPMSQTGAELHFEVLSQRHESGSTVVTSICLSTNGCAHLAISVSLTHCLIATPITLHSRNER